MARGFFPGKGSGCSLACPGGWGGLCLVLQQWWLFSVAQRAMWDGSLQGESSLVFAWGSVPGGTESIAGVIMTTVHHHHCGFLVCLKVEANVSLLPWKAWCPLPKPLWSWAGTLLPWLGVLEWGCWLGSCWCGQASSAHVALGAHFSWHCPSVSLEPTSAPTLD